MRRSRAPRDETPVEEATESREARSRRASEPDIEADTQAGRPAVHDDAATLAQGQRTMGNQAMARFLGGRPLPSGVRGRMEGAFGRSFADVRVHEGGVGDRMAERAGAPAAMSGEDLFFRRGAFRPDTTIGQALLAHELAHLAQGHDGQVEGRTAEAIVSPRMEAEGNRATFIAMANLELGTRERIDTGGSVGRRGGMAGLLPGSCFGPDSTIEAPDYLGADSLNTLERLNDRLGSLDMLGPVIALGTATTVGFGPPSDPSDTVESAARALAALPAIKRAVIAQEVTLLLLEHENDMNDEEKQFWHRILDGV